MAFGDLLIGAAHAHEHAEHAPLIGETGWVAIAMVIFIIVAWKPFKKTVLGGLDKRAEKIRADLDEAEKLREEAQATLSSFLRKQAEAAKDAEEIVAKARGEAQRIKADSEKSVAETIARREASAMEKIAQAEARASAEVRAAAVDAATQAAAKIFAETLTPAQDAELVAAAARDIPGRLN